MKVGLIGFFGVDAFSDDLINDATQRLLKSHTRNIEIDDRVMWKSVKGGKVDINYLNSFDLLILCGGSLLGKCSFLPVNSIEKWYKEVDTPLAIFGTGYRFEPHYEPLPDAMRRRMTILFEKAYPIMLRGLRSVYHCNLNEIPLHNVTALGEPIIGADYVTPVKRRNVIGGNVRDMPLNEVQYTSNDAVQHLMAKIYDWLIEETGMPLELVSWRNIEGDSDVQGALKTVRNMKNKNVTIIQKSLKGLLENMDYAFWFGQRCHPAVYCANIGVPFVGFDSQFEKMWDFLSVHEGDGFIWAFDDLNTFKEKYQIVLTSAYQSALKESVQRNAKDIHVFVDKMMREAQ